MNAKDVQGAPIDSIGVTLPWSAYAKMSDSSPSRGGTVPGSANGLMGDAEPHRQSFVQQDMTMCFSFV
jgi:hypothetical protein